MDPQHLLHTSYLDLLFQRRNKAYGGYELRLQYPARLKRALGAVLSVVAALSVYTVITDRLAPQVIAAVRLSRPDSLVALAPLELPKPVEPAAPAAPALAAAKAEIPSFRLTTDSVPALAPEPVPAPSGHPSGTGPAGAVAGLPGGTPGGTPGGSSTSTSRSGIPEPPSEPVLFADVPPEPPFDVNTYLSERIRYPEGAREAGIDGRVVLRFVVNEDGAISDVQVVKSVDAQLNAEAVRVVRSMPRWKPGRQQGRPVRVYFNLPVSFQLQ